MTKWGDAVSWDGPLERPDDTPALERGSEKHGREKCRTLLIQVKARRLTAVYTASCSGWPPPPPCQSFHRQPTTKVRGASPEITIDRPAAGRTQVALIESYA
ncbi:hypothetical protein [uncultured Lamprocystis sp.]|uniref:hypothetical protein n=1 Tax=uncultured Lamprocystis sp. TaxID=543132 RepID=UPI0025EA3B41|nr:hypothetical protein [uncultured Lamprocystis sp.]